MQRQDHFSSSPVDCSLCKWCLGNQQMKVLQGGMVMQMFHLPAWKSSAAKRERGALWGNQLPCTLLAYLILLEILVSTLKTNNSYEVRKEQPVCLFLNILV